MLRKSAESYGKHPTNEIIRETYYSNRRSYRRLIKAKKDTFFRDLCTDIESGKMSIGSGSKNLNSIRQRPPS